MKTKIKYAGLIISTLALFAISIYLAFAQGNVSMGAQKEAMTHLVAPAQTMPIIHTGVRAIVADSFAWVMNILTPAFSSSIFLAIITLALVIELLLLYPAVRIQLKQKKIHLFHKKLVDRFNNGELTVSDTKHELNLLYAVNEKIHSRGAVLFAIQMIVFFMALWGLSLIVESPYLLQGSWNVFNFSLLSKPVNFVIPLVASLLYFLHSLVKTYFKEKEDYISQTQSLVAILLAVISSAGVYYFATIFSVALTIYFVTQIAFATVRYIIVEQKSYEWGKMAQRELIHMLRTIPVHSNRFEYISQKWNHMPIVRHINFHLLEEALSMSLGVLVALNFFGAFLA
jgi:hypothetical protein